MISVARVRVIACMGLIVRAGGLCAERLQRLSCKRKPVCSEQTGGWFEPSVYKPNFLSKAGSNCARKTAPTTQMMMLFFASIRSALVA